MTVHRGNSIKRLTKTPLSMSLSVDVEIWKQLSLTSEYGVWREGREEWCPQNKVNKILQLFLQWGILINNIFLFMGVFTMNYYCNFVGLKERGFTSGAIMEKGPYNQSFLGWAKRFLVLLRKKNLYCNQCNTVLENQSKQQHVEWTQLFKGYIHYSFSTYFIKWGPDLRVQFKRTLREH